MPRGPTPAARPFLVNAVVVAIRGEERYVVLGTSFELEKLEVGLRRENGAWRIHRVGRRGES